MPKNWSAIAERRRDKTACCFLIVGQVTDETAQPICTT